MQQKIVLTGILSGALLWMPSTLVAQLPGSPQSGTPQSGMPQAGPRIPGQNPGGIPGTDTTNTPAPTKVDDKKFVKDATIGGLTEVELGKLAEDKGGSDAVKQFGRHLVDDHTKANNQLKEAASKAGFSVPESLDSKHQARIDKLSKLSGTQFDRAFIKDEVKDHESDVRAFKDESTNGTNADVKAFASNALPTLEAHLTMAKDLRKSGGTSMNGVSK